jgi:hypothetical protein
MNLHKRSAPDRPFVLLLRWLAVLQVKGPKKELSRKEKKAKAKERAARKARGEEVSDSEDDE